MLKNLINNLVFIVGLPLWPTWQRNHLQCGRPGFDPWVEKILWRRERLPTPVFWPRELHGLDSPRDHKESNMTERLSLSHGFKKKRKTLRGRKKDKPHFT